MTLESMLCLKMSQAGVEVLQQASICGSDIRDGRGLLATLPVTEGSSALQEGAALNWPDEASCSPGVDILHCIAVCTPLAYPQDPASACPSDMKGSLLLALVALTLQHTTCLAP